MSQFIKHLTENEVADVVKATLREEETQEIMGLLGSPVDGKPVSFADRLDMQVRALGLDKVVQERWDAERSERSRVWRIEQDIHFAVRTAHELVGEVLDRLASDVPSWVAEFRLVDADHAISDYEEGGVIPDLVDDQSLHLQHYWDVALRALLTAVKAVATDEAADYDEDGARVA